MKMCRWMSVTLMWVTVVPLSAWAADWKPVDPALLHTKEPQVEKDADAEAVFWEVRVNDEDLNLVLTHYIRIKIFTERGKETQSTIDIAYLGDNKIGNIAGRTIKPDGSIVELKKDAVFDRTLVKLSGVKVKAKSFAMPAVEPGAVIEYRWKETRPNEIANYLRLQFQRDIPVQRVQYSLKPLSLPSFTMRSVCFHGQNSPFEKERDGYYSTTMTNMPAFREEPRMPPEDQVRVWMLVFYAKDEKVEPQKFWKGLGKELYDESKSRMKVNDEVRKAAADIAGDASTPDQKLERLFEYCRTRIKNTNDDASGLTADDRKKLKENKSPSDTLKRGQGNGGDILMLFAALATAAGFDARVARMADRGDIFFDPSFTDSYFFHVRDVAVKVNNAWRFFDPASTYVPYGMLRWQEEGQDALVSDPKDPAFVRTPLSPAEKSLEKRTATLRLSEDGTLEGDVRIEYTGHFAAYHKEYNDDDSPTQREETLREGIKNRMSAAELSNIQIENITDPVKPFVYAYHIRVPGYAQRTGKRLFLQPAFFQMGVGPIFSASTRKHPIYFHYPWSEEDTVILDLPAGFALDSPDAPSPINVPPLSQYEVKISVTDGRQLKYKRKFFFGGLLFQPEQYEPLKQLFDALHKGDTHTLTLKESGAAASKK